jgi:hypothetical protein
VGIENEMPSRDMTESGALLDMFRGCLVNPTFGCNSLKLRVGRQVDRPALGYIWIDPPWAYSITDTIVQTSEACPYAEETDYQEKFVAWLRKMRPIIGQQFLDYTIKAGGHLTLIFSGDQRIEIPGNTRSPELWYDHWYASTMDKPEHLIPR